LKKESETKKQRKAGRMKGTKEGKENNNRPCVRMQWI
jgi:hypothetical protein